MQVYYTCSRHCECLYREGFCVGKDGYSSLLPRFSLSILGGCFVGEILSRTPRLFSFPKMMISKRFKVIGSSRRGISPSSRSPSGGPETKWIGCCEAATCPWKLFPVGSFVESVTVVSSPRKLFLVRSFVGSVTVVSSPQKLFLVWSFVGSPHCRFVSSTKFILRKK